MKDRPILFSAPMVRAVLDGTKTQTRRICKPAEKHALTAVVEVPDPLERGQVYNGSTFGDEEGDVQFTCPYGQPGDRLWVREAFAIVPRTAYANSVDVEQTLRPDDPYEHDAAIYREGWCRSHGGLRWRPSIHMPRWASRITLEITGVRVERLHDISEADAMAEGIVRQPNAGFGLADTTHYHATDPRQSYLSLWEAINGDGSVLANPWIWVLSLRSVST